MNAPGSRVAARAAARRLTRLPPFSPSPLARPTQRYSSSSAPAINHNVNESMGVSFWVLVATIPSATIIYNLAQPGANGKEPVLTSWLRGLVPSREYLFEVNTAWAQVVQQAAEDRHLFLYREKPSTLEMRYPEMLSVQSSRNVSASSYVNLDAVVEHCRNKYLEEEAAKPARRALKQELAKKLEAETVSGRQRTVPAAGG